MLYDDNKIEEINYQIYLKWFDEFITDIPITYFLYIQTDSNIAYQRVLKRNRKGENIDLDYLEMCNKYHDDWLIKKGTRNSFIINGNLTSENK